MRIRAPVLLLAGYAVLVVAWIWGDPLGAKVDESAHYTRAISVGQFHFGSAPPPPDSSNLSGLANRGRLVEIPAGLAAPDSWLCNAGQANKDGGCHNVVDPPSNATSQRTPASQYIPVGYVLPGLVMRLAGDPDTALRIGRVVGALAALALLAAGVLLLFDRTHGFSLLGPVVAITPMALYLASEPGPNGLEVPAAIAFYAGMLKLSRTWSLSWMSCIATAGAALVLGSDRILGPLWVLVGLALLATAPNSRRRVVDAARRAPAKACCLVACIGIGVILDATWDWLVRKTGTSLAALGTLGHSLDQVNLFVQYMREMVGTFGYTESLMTEPAYFAWEILVVCVFAVALVIGTRRERLLLVGLFVGGFVACALLAALYGPQGFEGRYILPWAVSVPLLSGEVLYRNRARWGALEPRHLVLYGAVLTALVQFVGFYYNARRQAVGQFGPLFFLQSAAWQPAGGWILWLAIAAGGATLIVIAGMRAAGVGGADDRQAIRQGADAGK